MLTHRDQVGLERHRWLQIKLAAVGVLHRRDAIQDNAWANPVVMRIWPQQGTAGGGNRTLARFTTCKLFKALHLFERGIGTRLIGTAEVAHDIHRLHHIAAGAETLIKRLGMLRADPQTMHAGIQLHPHRHRTRQRGLLQRFKLFDTVYGGFDVIGHQHRQILGREEALEHQDGFDDAAGAQLQRLANAGHAVTVGILQGVSCFQQAMSISVCFHNGNQATLRRLTAHLLQIMSQSAAVDYSGCRFHFSSLADYSSSYCGPA
ncbi:hypothetical protein D3C72_1165690 [compost metagenome]